MSREAKIFTDEVMAQVRSMVAAGKNGREIARHVGCEYDSLRGFCARHNISLRKTRADEEMTAAVIRLRLTDAIAGELRDEARRRGISFDVLAAEIIDAVVGEALYAAVLDN